MNKIKFEVNKPFIFFIAVTVGVNMICLVLQYFSMKRMWQTEKSYQAIRAEEMQMKYDIDEALRKKCKKHGIV